MLNQRALGDRDGAVKIDLDDQQWNVAQTTMEPVQGRNCPAGNEIIIHIHPSARRDVLGLLDMSIHLRDDEMPEKQQGKPYQ